MFAAKLLGPGCVLDLGCGVGHSYELLSPRGTVGVDLDPGALEGQQRATVVADMRQLPFEDCSFSSVLSVQSLEHVPDPDSVLAEAVRVLKRGGIAVFITPNRLTFGVPDEVIDPYHYVEYEAGELRNLLTRYFADVEIQGIFGSSRYMEIYDEERQQLDALLRRDPLRVRRLIPRRIRQQLYDWQLVRARRTDDGRALAITPADFEMRESGLDAALDLVGIGRLNADTPGAAVGSE
jgi:SAM-dependent methyltransferase